MRILWFLVILVIASCAHQRITHHSGSQDKSEFQNETYGIRLIYPADTQAKHSFENYYILSNHWDPDLGNIPGDSLISLRLPGSNSSRRAILRIGASRNAKAIASCHHMRNPPPHQSPSQTSIAGVDFTQLVHGEGGTSHFVTRHSYRGLHDDACIAIDLAVFTNSGEDKIHSNFSKKEAFNELQTLLTGLSFFEAAQQSSS